MRNAKVKKRKVQEDPVYNSKAVAKIINNIMLDGKKTVAQNIIYDMFDILAEKGGTEPMVTFDRALQNVGPKNEIKARRVGGANYQIPIEVRGERKNALAIRWIIEAARAKSNSEFHTFAEKLAAEILAAANNEGEAIKKRDNVHRMADANKAFAHFSRN